MQKKTMKHPDKKLSEPVPMPQSSQTSIAAEIEKEPLAPNDPRRKKPSQAPLQSSEDPLNGVNE